MPKKDLQPLHIYRMLPRTNCKACGCPTCYAFAFDLISRDKQIDDCPSLKEEKFAEAYRMLKDMIGEGTRIEGTDHVVDLTICTGCGDCVTACTRALTTVTVGGRLSKRDPVPPVMQVFDGAIQVINPTSCKRLTKGLDLCNVCADRCPFSAIELVKSEKEEEEEDD